MLCRLILATLALKPAANGGILTKTLLKRSLSNATAKAAPTARISVHESCGNAPSGQAWRSGVILRCKSGQEGRG